VSLQHIEVDTYPEEEKKKKYESLNLTDDFNTVLLSTFKKDLKAHVYRVYFT